MDNNMNDLIVNSKGHCFLCLDKISTTSIKLKNKSDSEKSTASSSSSHKLHCLSRYLKMDLTKVFSQKGSIPPSLIAKVEKSKLKVELCKECAGLANGFSLLYRQLEKLQMEMGTKVNQIQQKLLKVEESGKMKNLRWDNSKEDGGLMQVLEVLRNEAIEKCTSKISNRSPRIQIQKLTRKEIKAYEGSKKFDDAMASRPTPITEFQSHGAVKMDIQNDDLGLDDDDHGSDFFGQGREGDDDPLSGMSDHDASETDENPETIIDKISDSVTAKSQTPIKNVNFTINPKTRKYKCSICLKEFSRSAFRDHYRSIHLNVRYKCNLCEKIYSNRPNYTKHVKSAHIGVRFKCLMCDQQFISKNNLQRHQRSNACQT